MTSYPVLWSALLSMLGLAFAVAIHSNRDVDGVGWLVLMFAAPWLVAASGTAICAFQISNRFLRWIVALCSLLSFGGLISAITAFATGRIG